MLNLLSRIAATQSALMHQPHESATFRTYWALTRALSEQFAVVSAYLNLEFVTVDPYETSPQMFGDIQYRKRLKVFTPVDMDGSHPFAAIHVPSGQTYNTIFRTVHDALAHYPGRHSFGVRGEFRAFQAHARLLAGNVPAIHALATETLGQNAWYHFGPRSGEMPRPYAPQVAGLLPWPLIVEALEITV